jgi:hypothetical protein
MRYGRGACLIYILKFKEIISLILARIFGQIKENGSGGPAGSRFEPSYRNLEGME